MGIIYFFLLIIYVSLSSLICSLVKKFTNNIWYYRMTIVFLILLPTYDIIITKSLLFYYSNFTETEKIYKKVESIDSIYFEDKIRHPKGYNESNIETDIDYYLLKKNLFNKIEFYNSDNKIISIEKNNNILTQNYLNEKTANYTLIFRKNNLSVIISYFLINYELVIINNINNEILGIQKKYIGKPYNMWFSSVFGIDVKTDSCCNTNDINLINGVINGKY